MKYFKTLLASIAFAGLAACGGGGGSPGGTLNTGLGTNGSSTTTAVVSTTGNSQTTTLGAITVDILNGAGVSSTSISALEIAQITASVKDASGSPVVGAIVKFTESVSSLLTISPISATALTDSSGRATVEFRASSPTSAGATQIGASVIVSGNTVNASKAISISSAPAVVGTSPQLLANALNFLDVIPSDKSIVIAGSGGSGRSESASLRFRVVDKNNSPVKGVAVTFSIGSAPVTLNIRTATSDNDGVVVTTISSGVQATAVVVAARVDTRTISSQSDQLLVTTGSAIPAGFDLAAEKYNLNRDLTGDSSKVTVRVVDANGNPVADGLPIVFTTDFGAIGSSSQGGCTTLNGTCDVTYKVQDPRPVDGQFARVVASTRVGTGEVISDTLLFRVTSVGNLNIYSGRTDSLPVTALTFLSTCADNFTVFVGTPNSFPAPAGTVVTVKGLTPSGVNAAIVDGGTIKDQLIAPTRTDLTFSVDLAGITGLKACTPSGVITRTANLKFVFTAGATSKDYFFDIKYPSN